MAVHTFSSRDFTRDVSAAKRAAVDGPVFITDRGRPAFALLNIDDYHRMVGQSEPTLLELMDGIAGGADIVRADERSDLIGAKRRFTFGGHNISSGRIGFNLGQLLARNTDDNQIGVDVASYSNSQS